MLNYLIKLFLMVLMGSAFVIASPKTLITLQELQDAKLALEEEIQNTRNELKKVTDEDAKVALKMNIKTLNTQLENIEKKFEKIASGIDSSLMSEDAGFESTTLTQDFQMLLKPLVESAKGATQDMRKKAELEEEIEHYKFLLPYAVKADENIHKLIEDSNQTELKQELKTLEKYWQGKVKLITSNLNASLHELDVLEENSVSFSDSFSESTKNFFQDRGLVLFEGFVAFILVISLMNLLHHYILKLFPIFTKPSRSFYLRLLDLLYKVLTAVLAIIVPMAIFYYEEDWFLFSLGVLLLIALIWTFRNLMSNLWQQARLFLNIGAVREDERIYYEGLPWRVKNINIFTILENPTSKVRLRIPIESLVGLTSRPSLKHEPWFPCKVGDWMLLSDGYYGRVLGVSFEFIELEDLGGGQKLYRVSDFLGLTPLNISTDFRIVQKFGISYRHQKESTTLILEQLKAYMLEQVEKDGFSEGLKRLQVQFESAGDSSLNIALIADFNGTVASSYYTLRRALNRWAVDACNHYEWEIPFPQLTIHQAD
jgi:small-conductance mechanosensitive channel